MTDIIDFNLIAITRDLGRRPEVRHLAKVLSMLGPKTEDGSIAPIYIYMAYTLLEKDGMIELLNTTIAVCRKG